MKKLLFALLVSVSLIGCSVDASTVNADKFKNKVTYFQCQKTGEVFSVVGIEKGGEASQSGIGMAHIDRDDVTPTIKSQISGFRPFSNWQ